MNLRTIYFFLLFSVNGFSQSVYFSFPYQISGSTTGNTHPRVALSNNNPVVVWGDPGNNGNLFYSLWNGNGFDSPVQLTYNDENVMLGYAEGPVIKTHGDTVYICYVSMGSTEHRVYLRKSVNAGQTFTDTLIVNDRANGVSLEYANMTLDENGNPMIAFIRFENGDVPKQVFYRSYDGGISFTPEINATPDTLSQPCECCPSSLISENNMIYLSYRNNVNNIRDFYVSVSDNGGLSFDSLIRVDFTNWFSSSCPASGPSSFVSGDSLINVYMVKESNRTMIKASAVHKTNFQTGSDIYVDPAVVTGTFQMNYPEIAGNGDTIGIVWHDSRAGQLKTYCSYSVNGLSGLSAPYLVSDFISGIQNNPHITYKNGIFHIVWRDYSNDIVWYRKVSFDAGILAVENVDKNDLMVYPNPANESIQIQLPFTGVLNLFDTHGKLIYSQPAKGNHSISSANFENGIYFLELRGNENVLITRIVVLHN